MQTTLNGPYDHSFFEKIIGEDVRLSFKECRGFDYYSYRDQPDKKFEPDEVFQAEQFYWCRIIGVCEWGVKTYYKQGVYSPCRDWIIPFDAIERACINQPDPPPPPLPPEEIAVSQPAGKTMWSIILAVIVIILIAMSLLMHRP
jgi:hypothetical protein